MTRAMRPRPGEPHQRSTSRRGAAAAVVVALTSVAVMTIGLLSRQQHGASSRGVATATTTISAPEWRPQAATRRSIGGLPLRGVALQAPTGLRFLVADAPAPFVLDVDRGTVQLITGLPTNGERGVSVMPVGSDALVLSSRYCNRCRGSSVYLLRHGRTAATRLGTALDAVPSRDGQGVWMLRHSHAGGCTIDDVWLDGRPRRAARRVSCRTAPLAELPAGLLTSFTGPLGRNAHSALLRPDGDVVRVRDPHPQPVVGNLVLSGADRRTPLLLHDLATGTSRRLRWPSRPDYGLGEVSGQSDGRLATVDFAKYSPVHRFDLWLLDTTTGHWQHLPDMPAQVVPKITDVEWTADGRVVVLAADVLGVWRPGDASLAVRRVKAPKQPGSRFVVW